MSSDEDIKPSVDQISKQFSGDKRISSALRRAERELKPFLASESELHPIKLDKVLDNKHPDLGEETILVNFSNALRQEPQKEEHAEENTHIGVIEIPEGKKKKRIQWAKKSTDDIVNFVQSAITTAGLNNGTIKARDLQNIGIWDIVYNYYPDKLLGVNRDFGLPTSKKPKNYWTKERMVDDVKNFICEHGEFSTSIAERKKKTALITAISRSPQGMNGILMEAGQKPNRQKWTAEQIEITALQVFLNNDHKITYPLLDKAAPALRRAIGSYPGGLPKLRERLKQLERENSENIGVVYNRNTGRYERKRPKKYTQIVLTREQEHLLFSHLREDDAEAYFPTSDTKFLETIRNLPEDKIKKWEKILKGNPSAVDIIIITNFGLINEIVRKYGLYVSKGRLTFPDLTSAGRLGLFKALKKFDPERGNAFYTYARWQVLAEIQKLVRETYNISYPMALSLGKTYHIVDGINAVREREPTQKEVYNLLVALTPYTITHINETVSLFFNPTSPFGYRNKPIDNPADIIEGTNMSAGLSSELFSALCALTEVQKTVLISHIVQQKTSQEISQELGIEIGQIQSIINESLQSIRKNEAIQTIQARRKEKDHSDAITVFEKRDKNSSYYDKTQSREKNIERLLSEGYTNTEISKIVGLTRQRIDEIRKKYKQKGKEYEPNKPISIGSKIDKLLIQGLSPNEVINCLETNLQYVHERKRRLIRNKMITAPPTRMQLRERAIAENPELVRDVKRYFENHPRDKGIYKGQRNQENEFLNNQIKALLIEGLKPTEIAAKLKISKRTVWNRKRSLML